MDSSDAYASLIEHRQERSAVDVSEMTIKGTTKRSRITKAKEPMLTAILNVLKERRDFWPLSVRAVHYALLNDPPPKHASNPNRVYQNTKKDCDSLTDLLGRARVAGRVKWSAIEDPTRSVSCWSVHRTSGDYIQSELNSFCNNYWRDLMQSQPNHIEIVGEKNTIASIIKPVAMKYCIPMTIGRGYCSLPPRYQMAERYRQSGKDKLVLLLLSDFDPDGDEIAHSFARSMRDGFGVVDICPVRVALTAEQVGEYELPPIMEAKKSSAHYDKFTAQNGTAVFELEALSPDQLQAVLRESIDSVIDIEAFNTELDREKEDAAFVAATRNTIRSVMVDINLDQDGR